MNNQHSNKPDFLVDFIGQQVGVIKFIIIAAVVYAALYIFYASFLIDLDIYARYINLLASLASELLNKTLGEATYTIYVKATLVTKIHLNSSIYIDITKDADAYLVSAMLFSAIFAWPGEFWKKLVTVCFGVLFVFCLNITRIACMLLADTYYPLQFDVINIWLLPNLLILAAIGYFFLWIKISGRHPADSH